MFRNLPTLHFGPQPVFAARQLQEVKNALLEYLGFAMQAKASSLYQLQACRFNGFVGLYGRDGFNRSAYKRRLENEGFSFFGPPIIEFDSLGAFVSGGVRFNPTFAILGGSDKDGGVLRHSGAIVPFTLASYRLGPIAADELRPLIALTSVIVAIGARTPLDAAEYLRTALS